MNVKNLSQCLAHSKCSVILGCYGCQVISPAFAVQLLSILFWGKFNIYSLFFLVLAALGLRCCTRAFSGCGEGGYSSLRCTGFSLRWLLLLWSMGSSSGLQQLKHAGSVVVAHRPQSARASVVAARGLSSCGLQALECRLSSCGARAQLLRSMWDLPGPGLKPVSPALTGGFLTIAPPGKS